MNCFQCSALECLRKPVKSFCLFMILTVIFVGLILGIRVYDSSRQEREEALRQIGSYILLEKKELNSEVEGGINRELLQEILLLPHVRGINQMITEYALPVNFDNSKEHSGETPENAQSLYEGYTDLTPNSVILSSALDLSFLDDFRLGYSKIIEGRYVSEDNPGLMIEQHLAEENDFHIGDSLLLTCYNGNVVEAEIQAIYRTSAFFEITKDNSIGEAVYAMSPYNKIYSSLDIGKSLYCKKEEDLPYYIYIDNPSNVQKTGEAVKEMSINWEKYNLYNMTETMYRIEGEKIQVMENYSKLLLFYVLAFGILFLSLFLSLYSYYYRRDAGIYLALGYGKVRILEQYYICTAIISIFSGLTATVISGTLYGRLFTGLTSKLPTEAMTISSFYNGLEVSYDVQNVMMSLRGAATLLLVMIVFILCSGIPLLVNMTRFQPREILDMDKE